VTVASGGAKGAEEFILQIVLLDAYLGPPEKAATAAGQQRWLIASL